MLKRPLKFAPYLKTVIWGGEQIAKYKGINTDLHNIGESWELSPMSGHESTIIDDEEYEGLTINQLAERQGADLLGTDIAVRYNNEFPLLIKIIDATKDLSVQVHPDDRLALSRHGCKGKTEMWYIIDATEGAKIYSGLNQAINADEYTRLIAEKRIMDVVDQHESKAGQFYYIPSGTIHAIGAGNLVAEIQQACDITYRVYDYDRRDANGQTRELHTEQAKDAINYQYPRDLNPTAQIYESTKINAVDSDYFSVSYIKLADGDTYEIDTKGRWFVILLIAQGTLDITLSDGTKKTYGKGTTVLLPASMEPCKLSGNTTVLLTQPK